MIELCPAKRITAKDALQHDYFSASPPKEESIYKEKVKKLYIDKLEQVLKKSNAWLD